MKITDEMLYECAPEARDLWLSCLPQKHDTPAHRFSRRFRRKMRKLLREQRHSARFNSFVTYTKRVAMVAIVIFTIAFSSLMTVESFRAKFIEVVTHVFEDLTSFGYSSDAETPEPLPNITFGYLPDGLEESRREQSASHYYISFEDPSGRYIDITLRKISTDEKLGKIVDTEDPSIRHITINGQKVAILTKNGISTVTWTVENYLINFYSNLDSNELIRIAENIKI